RRFPSLAGLEAVVSKDNRRPACPDVEGKADGVVLHFLIGGRALHRGESFRRTKRVFLDGRDARGVGCFGLFAAAGATAPGRDRNFWPTVAVLVGDFGAVAIGLKRGEGHESHDDDEYCDGERGLGLSGHDGGPCALFHFLTSRRRWRIEVYPRNAVFG